MLPVWGSKTSGDESRDEKEAVRDSGQRGANHPVIEVHRARHRPRAERRRHHREAVPGPEDNRDRIDRLAAEVARER